MSDTYLARDRGCLLAFALCASIVASNASPTDGFIQQSVTVGYEWPYDLNLSDRHTGTFPGLEHFWVYNTDSPHAPPPNTTAPRCEAVPSPRWTSGIWQFEGDVMVPTGSTGHNLMQVFGADPSIGATSCMLRTYNGNLTRYQTTLQAGIYDQWLHINVIHDNNLHTIKIYVNGVLKRTDPDNDAGNHPTHYFKYGVYQETGTSAFTECYWQNVKIWYAPADPWFVKPLLSRVADTGTPVGFAAFGGITSPFSYQWRRAGTNIPGALGSSYTIPSPTTNHSGSYAVVLGNANGSITSSVVSLTIHPPQAMVFADDFDTNTSANWTLNRSSADTRVTFAWDYSALGIPSAPHSTGGTTKGVKLEANLTAGVVAALSMSPIGLSFNGDYRLRFDMWMNANGPFPNGGNGSTEFLTAGIGTVGNRVEWTGSGNTADGCWFSVDAEGGVADTSTTSGDYCAYNGTSLQTAASGIYAAGTASTARVNGNSYYTTAFPGGALAPALQRSNYPQQTGALATGTIGFGWHDVIVSRRGSTVEWSIDGVKLATITNVTLPGNNISLGYWDPFASLSDNTNLSFGLIDNVRVEVPAVAPAITLQPHDALTNVAANVTFEVTATGLPAPAYQWRFNGTNITDASSSSYTVTNAQAANRGNYSVLITNVAGSITSSNAALALISPQRAQFQSIALQPDRSVRLLFTGDPAVNYSLETSTNLQSWYVLTNLTSQTGSFDFNTGATTNDAKRFYRLRWP